MEIINAGIDAGKAFDWGRTSSDYAVFRDIYPPVFYEKIASRGLCTNGQRVLDLGTGTGVLPRNMYRFGAQWTGTDISENQIEQAKKLAGDYNMNIEFVTAAAEKLDLPDSTFDVVTACQCFWYFDCKKLMPVLSRLLKNDGRFLLLCMEWLPYEDKIAGASEELVLKYTPEWSGAGATMKEIELPGCVSEYFELVYHEEYLIDVPFTRETWNGRMKTCRGVGASLTAGEIESWEKEHRRLLSEIAPESFTIKHYAAMTELKLKG